MDLALEANVDIELDIVHASSEGSGSRAVGHYVMTGPPTKMSMLTKLTRAAQRRSQRGGKAATAVASLGVRARVDSTDDDDDASAGASGNVRIEGKLSPLSRVSVSEEMQQYACIPADAEYYAFAYPAEGMEQSLEELNLADERWVRRRLTLQPSPSNLRASWPPRP